MSTINQQSLSIEYSELSEVLALHGLTLFGVTSADALEVDRQRLEEWQEKGFAGDLHYMTRESELFASPRRLLSSAQSVVLIAAPYSNESSPDVLPGYGRVARYAWGKDYHKVLRKLFAQIEVLFRDTFGTTLEMRTFSDAVPFLERAFAAQAGIGFVGKNSLIIRPGTGSYFFLGEIIWNVSVKNPPPIASLSGCGSCQRCINKCPTEAIVAPMIVDARRCIANLTIEKRDLFSPDESRAIGSWLFGCDVCQEVCPYNHRIDERSPLAPWVSFLASAGVGPTLSLADILALESDSSFLRTFAGTALLRTKRAGLIRNAAAVAANQKVYALIPQLQKLSLKDSSELVRSACGQALELF